MNTTGRLKGVVGTLLAAAALAASPAYAWQDGWTARTKIILTPSQAGASSAEPQFSAEAAKSMLMFIPQSTFTTPPSRRRATIHYLVFVARKSERRPRGRLSHFMAFRSCYVPAGRPRGDGREMSIIAIRSFSSYQQWKRLMPGTSIS